MSKRILIVDDCEDFAHGMAALLSHMGHDTCVTYDGTSALARAAVFAPDAVIIDLHLPGLNGQDIAHALRKLRVGNALLLICITGGSFDTLTDLDFDFYLQKPVNYELLKNILDASP